MSTSAVREATLYQAIRPSPNSLLLYVATNGSAAHLLKVGSKRRRTREELDNLRVEQLLVHQLEEDHKVQVKNLKIQLSVAEEQAQNNENATKILTQLIESGAVEQLPDGTIKIPQGTNVIMN